jgi:autotransporter-associated beta strand protein
LGGEYVLPTNTSVIINGGILAIGDYHPAVKSFQLLSGSITGSSLGSLTSNTDYDLQIGSVSARLAGSVGLTKSGTGSVMLSKANPFYGTTTINAGTLTIGTETALANSNAVVVNGGTLNVSSYSPPLNALKLMNGTISGPGTLMCSSNYDLRTGTVSAKLGGSVGLVKSGPGTVILSGINSFTETITVNGGALVAGTTSAFPNIYTRTYYFSDDGMLGVSVSNWNSDNFNQLLNNSSCSYNVALESSSTITCPWNISGSHGIAKVGSGTVTLTGTNNYSGPTSVYMGTLTVGIQNAIPTNTLDNSLYICGGNFNFSNYSFTFPEVHLLGGNITGSGTITSAADYDLQSGTISARLAGTVGLTKSGPGIVTLSGSASNSYSGPTVVSDGTLVLAKMGSANAIGGDSLIIGDGTNPAKVQYSSSGTSTNMIADSVPITINKLGTLDLNGKTDTLGPITFIGGGTITMGTPSTGTGKIILNGDVTYTAAASDNTMALISGNGNLDLNANRSFSIADTALPIELAIIANVANGSGTNAITKTGSGTLILSGVNAYSGGVTITGGILRLGSDSAVPTMSEVRIEAQDRSATILDLNGHNLTLSALYTGTPAADFLQVLGRSNEFERRASKADDQQ